MMNLIVISDLNIGSIQYSLKIEKNAKQEKRLRISLKKTQKNGMEIMTNVMNEKKMSTRQVVMAFYRNIRWGGIIEYLRFTPHMNE